MSLADKLAGLEKAGKAFRVGVIGGGTFGTQLVAQSHNMKGIRINVICDLDINRAFGAYELSGISRQRVVHANEVESINQAISEDSPCVTSKSTTLIQSDVDIVVEATGIEEVAARNAYESIMKRKHVVMVSVEADVLVGPLLKKIADNAGVVYTLVYGDEPSLAYEIFERVEALGFRVIASGEGRRYTPEFRKATPDDVFEKFGYKEKSEFKANPKMFNSFLDGTKHSVQETALSNMTGLTPDVRGLHFPAVDLRDIPDTLSLKSKGGILEKEGVVEDVSSIKPNGTTIERNLRGGVFSVVEAPTKFLKEAIESYGIGIGTIQGQKTGQLLVYRPQHLVGLEAPVSLVKIALYKEATGAPRGWFSEVVTAAKKNLKPGMLLDGGGGYMSYGLIERADIAKEQNLLPFGLSPNAEVIRNIPEDKVITYDDVKLNKSSFARELRNLQESSLRPGHLTS